MLICEDVMILLARPRGMVENWDARRQWGVTAGALCDLEEASRISMDGKEVQVLSRDATGHPALDAVLTYTNPVQVAT
ncbi:GPP34 family phosphoprotein [Austwickia chelonae]|uniref:GPP34 family phosphoprotein n=1 Tax=Austwickia chelonae TaxID=100225 RepID=UPI000E2732CC|nr:GPP34 family phosphoprotein [Austwickia chelonae]